MIRKLVALVVALGIAGAAFASSCPLLMKDIDAALEDSAVTGRLTEAQLAEVRQLRKQGEAAHKAGDHPKSMAALGRAKEVLGIS